MNTDSCGRIRNANINLIHIGGADALASMS